MKKNDLQAIRDTVNRAELSDEARCTALWYLDKLPPLYQELETTYENRFLDEILRHVQAMLKTIEAPRSVEAITLQLRAMHERHGIPKLSIKLPATVAVKPTRASKVAATATARTGRQKKPAKVS